MTKGCPFAPVKFEWPDNLAFDGDGNLWVLQDGGNNHLWVVAPTHTTAAPAIKVFGNTPAGCESTGIAFSPDYKFLFISMQHSSGSNTAAQTDATGVSVVFDDNTTLVISRKENLGGSTLPLKYVSISVAQRNNAVNVNWVAAGVNEHGSFEVERSIDGVQFTRIGAVASSAGTSSYAYTDNSLPIASSVYYRIRQYNNGEPCTLSDIKSVKISGRQRLKVYPLSSDNAVRVLYTSNAATNVLEQVYNNNGIEVYRQKRLASAGMNGFTISIANLAGGMYVIKMSNGGITETGSFVK
ncbi:MAG: DUF839 domain-containing protein [Bacteroidota bacterium]|nr:DUF839 domain-containing protein [Bacteroidota bacterium]